MLQTQAVNSTLLRVLRGLMALEDFQSLQLVGGTSLALQFGHRDSIDIDLFGKISFDYDKYSAELSEIGKVEVLSKSKNINMLTIDSVKVDFVNYRYPWIKPPVIVDGLRLASVEDIAAMKLNAITGRGSKKDFIDLYYLLNKYSFKEMFRFYEEKFDDGNLFLVRKSLSYFIDADDQEIPKMMTDITWEVMKNSIIKRFEIEGM